MVISVVEERADEVTVFALREMDIRPCMGCFGCWIKTPGECVIDDDGREVARAIVNSDLVVYFTPVTFGGYSSELKKSVDRNICIIEPDFAVIDGETHHKKRYEQYPRMLAVGLLDQVDPESEGVFRTLVKRNAINMHAPASGSTVIYTRVGSENAQVQIERALDEVGVAI
jgi:hypothetical protein